MALNNHTDVHFRINDLVGLYGRKSLELVFRAAQMPGNVDELTVYELATAIAYRELYVGMGWVSPDRWAEMIAGLAGHKSHYGALAGSCRRCESRNINFDPTCNNCGYGKPGDRASISVVHDGLSPEATQCCPAMNDGHNGWCTRLTGEPFDPNQLIGPDDIVPGHHSPASDVRPPWKCAAHLKPMPHFGCAESDALVKIYAERQERELADLHNASTGASDCERGECPTCGPDDRPCQGERRGICSGGPAHHPDCPSAHNADSGVPPLMAPLCEEAREKTGRPKCFNLNCPLCYGGRLPLDQHVQAVKIQQRNTVHPEPHNTNTVAPEDGR